MSLQGKGEGKSNSTFSRRKRGARRDGGEVPLSLRHGVPGNCVPAPPLQKHFVVVLHRNLATPALEQLGTAPGLRKDSEILIADRDFVDR